MIQELKSMKELQILFDVENRDLKLIVKEILGQIK